MAEDIRWIQRFSNYQKALSKLKESVNYIQEMKKNAQSNTNESRIILDEMIREGVIQRFEYTHELAWNTMKDYSEYQGIQNIGGSRDATREAFQMHLIANGQMWMDMIQSRNKTTHTYNEDTADEIFSKIIQEYFFAFLEFETNMISKLKIQDRNIL